MHNASGSCNILKKVVKQLGIHLAKLGSAALTLPHRYDLFRDLKKTYCEKLLYATLVHRATTM